MHTTPLVSQLHRSCWVRIVRVNGCFERLGVGDDRFEVFNTDTNPQLVLDGELLKIQLIYSYGCLQGMFEDFCQQSVL